MDISTEKLLAARQKLDNQKIPDGGMIWCPYCDAISKAGDGPCCDELTEALK